MSDQADIEAAILLKAVQHPEARALLLAAAQPQWFSDLRHQHVFSAIRTLHNAGKPVDMAGVKRETALLSPIDASWFEQALFLAKGMTRDSYERVHLPALREAFAVTSLAAISGDLCERALSQTATSQELLAWLDGRLEELRRGESTDAKVVQEAELIGSIGKQDAAPKNPIRSGIQELDAQGIRFDPGKSTVIAARPKHGKSSLVMQLAISLSGFAGVALFNLEMGLRGWRERRLPQIAKVDFETYARGEADDLAAELVSLYDHFAKHRPLYVIEPSGGVMSASEILATVRKMVREGKTLGYVIVDQMQQISDWDTTRRGEGRDMQPTRIIRELVNGCKALGVHVIMVHQLSRNADTRKDKEPVLADLAETSYFERVADAVLFVYRPNFDVSAGDDGPKDDYGFVKVAASRYGPPGRCRVSWNGEKTQFGTWGDPIMAQVYEHRNTHRDRLEEEAV